MKFRKSDLLQIDVCEQVAGKEGAHTATARVDRMHVERRVKDLQSTREELAGKGCFLLGFAAQNKSGSKRGNRLGCC